MIRSKLVHLLNRQNDVKVVDQNGMEIKDLIYHVDLKIIELLPWELKQEIQENERY